MRISKFSLNEEQEPLRLRLGPEELEEVSEFKYLGSIVSTDGGMEEELKKRLGKGAKLVGGLWRKRGITIFVKMGMLKYVVIPTEFYGSES